MMNASERGDAQQRLKLYELVVVTLGASVLDVLVTHQALSNRWGVEMNPFARHGMSTLGLNRLVALNLALRLAIVGGLALIIAAADHPRARAAATIVLTGVGVWWTVVAISNVFMLTVALA